MTVPRYVPILKGKQGELDALKDIQPSTRRGMLPLIEVVPGDPDAPSFVADTKKACKVVCERLAKAGYTDRVMLDAGLFNLSVPIDGHRSVNGLLMAEARAKGLAAQAVIRIGDEQAALDDASEAWHKDGHGLTLRLVGEDLDEDPEDLDQQIETLLLIYVGAQRRDVDLVIDLAMIDGDVAVKGYARLAVSLLRELPKLEEWASVTVASGAFPADLSAYAPFQIEQRSRYDAELYDRVVQRNLPRVIDYGDYAVAHPLLGPGGPYAPPPQLRYTAADHWLILKGKRTHRDGNGQFHAICQEIAQHPDFVGPRLGRADQRIYDGSPEGPGNGTTWRRIGTTHHLDLVVERLTTLGEP